jgi:hypothetical protein
MVLGEKRAGNKQEDRKKGAGGKRTEKEGQKEDRKG